MNIVINATEGGAFIKGTTQLSLKESIDKYCTRPIDKSKVTPLLTLANDGDELITRVIPLLQDDIDVLDEIILQSRRGIAVNRGLKNLTGRNSYKNILTKKDERALTDLLKESSQQGGGNFIVANQLFYAQAIKAFGDVNPRLKNILILSDKNFRASEIAHTKATQNPLVNVAIYGASRAIQGRQLKVKETFIHFLKNPADAQVRIKRNMFILQAAKKASESLKAQYEKTLDILKRYDKTKDESLLISSRAYCIDLNDSEKYFKAGNWAHPYLDAKKVIEQYEKDNSKTA